MQIKANIETWHRGPCIMKSQALPMYKTVSLNGQFAMVPLVDYLIAS